MEKKYNSTNNPKNYDNHMIFNLKSTFQRINNNNNLKENKKEDEQEQKNFNDLLENHLINSTQNDKTSKLNKNLTNDDISLDNISNIISKKQSKLPDTRMFFEDKESSLFKKQNHTNQYRKNLNNMNSFSYNNIKACDSHTKSFHLKMKKMKEMNKTIMKDNYITKNNKTLYATSRSDKDIYNDFPNSFDNSQLIINFKQKIIYMKNKNKLLKKGNILFNDTENNNICKGSFNFVNEKNNKKIEEEKNIPFLCCFSKS
jgi:ribosome biogenesis protein Nip4